MFTIHLNRLYFAFILSSKKLLGRFIKKIINKKKLKKKLKRNFFNLRDKFYLLYKKTRLAYYIKRYFYLKYDLFDLQRRVNIVVIIYFRVLSFAYATKDSEIAKLLWNIMLSYYWDELSLTSFNDLSWEYPLCIDFDLLHQKLYINSNINNNNNNKNNNNNNNTITSMLPPGNWNKDFPKPEMKTYGLRPASIYTAGFFPTPDVENTRKNYELYKYDLDVYKRKKLPKGPRFKFLWESLDKSKKKWVYPELYHDQKVKHSLSNDTMRIYEEASLRYVYHTYDTHMRNRKCNITYPDGTRVTIFNKRVVLEHIKYHRKNVAMNLKHKPRFIYHTWYKDHFEPFRKAKINAFLSKEKPSFKRESISINELLNPVEENNNLNIKKIGINDLLNVDNSSSSSNNTSSSSSSSSNLNTKEIAINDLLNIDNDNSNLNTSKKGVNNLSDKDKVIDKKSWKYFVENSKIKPDPLWCVKTNKGWIDLRTINFKDHSDKNIHLVRLYYEKAPYCNFKNQ
jgi:hypothetical protein